jgi:hypothetical protein
MNALVAGEGKLNRSLGWHIRGLMMYGCAQATKSCRQQRRDFGATLFWCHAAGGKLVDVLHRLSLRVVQRNGGTRLSVQAGKRAVRELRVITY